MKTTITREPFDSDACRERLRAITTDAAALDSFERVAQTGEMESEYPNAFLQLNLLGDILTWERSHRGSQRGSWKAGSRRVTMNWLECVELKSAIAEEDVRFRIEDTFLEFDSGWRIVKYPSFDFTCDQERTISDVWEGIKWLVHIPGDLLLSWVLTSGMLQFFELGDTPYGTYFSTGLGWWIVLCLLFNAIFSAIKESFQR